MTHGTLEIRLSLLVIKDDEPPMSWDHVGHLVAGRIIDVRPIEVSAMTDAESFYRIENGRHRFVAAMVRGDETLTAVITPLS